MHPHKEGIILILLYAWLDHALHHNKGSGPPSMRELWRDSFPFPEDTRFCSSWDPHREDKVWVLSVSIGHLFTVYCHILRTTSHTLQGQCILEVLNKDCL